MSVSVDETVNIIRQELRGGKLRIPAQHDKVYKDECMYSFDNPYCETGLYINIQTFCGIGKEYLSLDSAKTNCKVC